MLAMPRHTHHHFYANMQTIRKRKRRRDKNSLHHRDHLVDCSLLLCKFNVVCAHPKPKEWTEANDANGKFFFSVQTLNSLYLSRVIDIFVLIIWYFCRVYCIWRYVVDESDTWNFIYQYFLSANLCQMIYRNKWILKPHCCAWLNIQKQHFTREPGIYSL